MAIYVQQMAQTQSIKLKKLLRLRRDYYLTVLVRDLHTTG